MPSHQPTNHSPSNADNRGPCRFRRSVDGLFALTPRGFKAGPRQSRAVVGLHVRPRVQARFDEKKASAERAGTQAALLARKQLAIELDRSGGRITLPQPKSPNRSGTASPDAIRSFVSSNHGEEDAGAGRSVKLA